MSAIPVPPPLPLHDEDLAAAESKAVNAREHDLTSSERDEDSIDLKKEIYDTSAIDPVLAKKMALTNNAIDEIGMTPWQWKLFCLNGFGYAVDSVRLKHIFKLSISLIPSLPQVTHSLPVDCATSRGPRIWKSEQAHCWRCPGFPDWTPGGRRCLGLQC